MNRNPDLRLPWLPLFALGCFACSTFVGAQQTSGMAAAGLAPAAGATRSALYIHSSGPDRQSMRDFASPTGSRAFNPAGSINSRSTWMAGANSTDPAGALILWNTPQANFPGASASSWNAGARSFGLDRQQGGIWLGVPVVGIPPDIYTSLESSELFAPSESNSDVQSGDLFSPSEPTSNFESGESFIPLVLTPKGASLIKGAALSAPYSLHSGTDFGMRGVAKPFAAQRGIKSVKSQFGSRTGGFGSIGNGSGSKPASLVPSTGMLNGPANDDTLRINEGIGSEKTLGSDELNRVDETSH